MVISGQLTLANMLCQSLDVRVLCKGSGVSSPQLSIDQRTVGTSLVVSTDMIHAIKVRYSGSDSWSGGLSVTGNKAIRSAVMKSKSRRKTKHLSSMKFKSDFGLQF